MVGAALGKEGFELLPDGLDEVRFECGHGACSFRSGSLENSPHDGASVPALHHDALPIDGSSKSNALRNCSEFDMWPSSTVKAATVALVSRCCLSRTTSGLYP